MGYDSRGNPTVEVDLITERGFSEPRFRPVPPLVSTKLWR